MAISQVEFSLSQIGKQFSSIGTLSLCCHEINLAGYQFNQFWLPKPGLFGLRNQQSSNHTAVLDFYRQLVCTRIFDRDSRPAKTHLLASLLPNIRGNRAQDIFPDASVMAPKNCPTESEFNSVELEARLATGDSERVSIIEFCNRNREAVEFPDFPDSTFALYRKFESELLNDAKSQWWDDAVAATDLMEQRWLRWCDGFGRRRSNEVKKDVLNILSYESKAAFHQAYSALWFEIIPHLIVNQQNQKFSKAFHALWHLDHRFAVPGHSRDIHLLHGLTLGLHPAFGTLLTTETGSRLVGETVAAPENIAAQERFLHAGLVALYLYAAARRSRC